MIRKRVRIALAAVPFMLAAVVAGAEELTVESILTVQKFGAPPAVIIKMIDSPSNTLVMTAGDIIVLRDAGVPKSVITAVWPHIPETPAPLPLQPDDERLVGLVRLIKAGSPGSLIAKQVRHSSNAYDLSANDLIYLKENGVDHSTVAALLAAPAESSTKSALAPTTSVSFDDLELVNTGFWGRDHEGRLVMRGNTLAWEDRRDPEKSFEIRILGLQKVWYTCEQQATESYCYQLNLEVTAGYRYGFQDARRKAGTNAAINEVMDALRTHFPYLPFGPPEY
jgi:hypothetical protein